MRVAPNSTSCEPRRSSALPPEGTGRALNLLMKYREEPSQYDPLPSAPLLVSDETRRNIYSSSGIVLRTQIYDDYSFDFEAGALSKFRGKPVVRVYL